MSLRIVVDMNLPPVWVPVLQQAGYTAAHWSTIGDPRADDATIMGWAVANGHIVFTHDLDFDRLLALTHANGPSVIQLRTQDVLPDQASGVLLAALRQHESDLQSGALIVVDEAASRVRVLPI